MDATNLRELCTLFGIYGFPEELAEETATTQSVCNYPKWMHIILCQRYHWRLGHIRMMQSIFQKYSILLTGTLARHSKLRFSSVCKKHLNCCTDGSMGELCWGLPCMVACHNAVLSLQLRHRPQLVKIKGGSKTVQSNLHVVHPVPKLRMHNHNRKYSHST